MNLDESLNKILEANSHFGDSFYSVFFERHPEAKKYFDGTDMQRQSLMLTMSLKLMGEYRAKGFAAIEHYLQHLGTRHSDRGVPRDVYPKWRDALLVTLEKFHGDDWNDDLAGEWRDAVDAMREVMFEGYNRRVGL